MYLTGTIGSKSSPELIEKIITYFKQAIEKDPNYALAYAALAEAYTVLSIGFSILPKQRCHAKSKKSSAQGLGACSGTG